MTKYYNINFAALGSSVQDALIDFYGDNVIVHYTDASNIIFSCPATNGQVVKITYGNYTNTTGYPRTGLSWYVGSSYSSGTTITDSITMLAKYGATDYKNSVATYVHLILSDTFLYCAQDSSVNSNCSHHFIIGKLRSGKYLAIAGYRNIYTSSLTRILGDTAAHTIRFICPHCLVHNEGKLLCTKASICDNNMLMSCDDGTLDGFDGIYVAGGSSSASVVGTNYFVSMSGMYGTADQGAYLMGRLVFPLDA